MRSIFFECSMGAAGDMLSAALLELVPDKAGALAELNSLGLPDVEFCAEKVYRCGVGGTLMTVKVNGGVENECHGEHEHHHEGHSHHHGHHHSGMDDVKAIIEATGLSELSKSRALEVYKIIAEAESEVHGCPVTEVHFHEVGMMDAVADVSAFCFLLERLAPEKIFASPVCVGSGHVKCAHGILPVPAPAAALILRGVPIYGGKVEGELCTPTGAALLKYFVSSFGPLPEISVSSIGYGMGKKEFKVACPHAHDGDGVGVVNCVRAFLGEVKA